MREIRYVYLKCDRVHEKHVAQFMIVYRLCLVFTVSFLFGVLIDLLV